MLPQPLPPNHPEIAFFDLIFTVCSPKSHPGGWVGKQIWERSPKKYVFFFFFGGGLP